RQLRGVRRLGRDLYHLVRRPLGTVEVPHPDRGAQVLETGHHAGETVGPGRVVGRSQLQHHLILGTEVDRLPVLAPWQIPDVQTVTVAAAQQDLAVDAVLDHLRRPPLAGDGDVLAEVPPEVVGQVLRSPVELEAPLHGQSVVVEDEDPAGPLAVRRAEGADVHVVGPAVNGVRTAVAGAAGYLLRLDDLHDLGAARVRFGVDDVDAARPQAGHQEVAALDVRVRSEERRVGEEGRYRWSAV